MTCLPVSSHFLSHVDLGKLYTFADLIHSCEIFVQGGQKKKIRNTYLHLRQLANGKLETKMT